MSVADRWRSTDDADHEDLMTATGCAGLPTASQEQTP